MCVSRKSKIPKNRSFQNEGYLSKIKEFSLSLVSSLKSILHKVFGKLNLDVDEHVVIEGSLLRTLDLDTIYGDNSRAKNELNWDYNLTTDNLIETLIDDEITKIMAKVIESLSEKLDAVLRE